MIFYVRTANIQNYVSQSRNRNYCLQKKCDVTGFFITSKLAPIQVENGRDEGDDTASTSQQQQLNGATSNGVLHGDGAGEGPAPGVANMSDTDKDIVRLIGQHLQSLGLQ